MALFGKKKQNTAAKYPGIRRLMNGSEAIIACEKESTDAAGAYLSTPASEMSAGWNKEKDQGHLNIANRGLISVNPEDTPAAASVTAGLALSGLRATHFCASAQSVASMHESLYASVGKRLPYVLNIVCKAVSKASSNIHCGHDDYHSMDDTGFIQFFARNNQAAADLNIISRKIAELSLNPAAVAQDGFLTSQTSQVMQLPERELIAEFLGLADDIIETPTAAQEILYGKNRRRVPETWSIDQPAQSGGIQDSDSYMKTVAGQRPYFFDHVKEISEQCLQQWAELTGRQYQRVNSYKLEDADYLIIAQGSVLDCAEAAADYLRQTRKLNVGVLDMTQFRPFPGDLLSHMLKGRKGVAVLERTDQPMSEDLPIASEIRNCLSKAIENANSKGKAFPDYASYNKNTDTPALYSACFGLGGQELSLKDMIAVVDNMLPKGKQQKFAYLGIDFVQQGQHSPQQEIQQQAVLDAYPDIADLALTTDEIPAIQDDTAIHLQIHGLGNQQIQRGGIKIAELLFQHFAYHIKAHPAFGTEKKSQPSGFYVTASEKAQPQQLLAQPASHIIIRNREALNIKRLADLKNGGQLIVNSGLKTAQEVWQSFSAEIQQLIVDRQAQVFFIDAAAIAQQTDKDPGKQFELQNTLFLAVFFKLSELAEQSDKNIEQFQALLDDNIDLVKRAYNEVNELKRDEMSVGDTTQQQQEEVSAPLLLQQSPANNEAIADIHRFWNHSGNLYRQQQQGDTLPDPFTASGVVPASTGIFGDMTANRSQHPEWIAENCTACGQCYKACPDSAIPGLINSVNEVFESNITRIEKSGHKVKHLRRAIRTVEKKYHALTADKSVGTNLDPIFAKAIGDTVKEYPEPEREEVAQEFEWFKQVIGDFKFALTEPYHDEMNNRMPRNGGLFSITINPNSCKGCMECVSVCETEALKVVEQTDESVHGLRGKWQYWLDLPNSNKKYSRIDDLEAKQGVLDSLLLDKNNYHSMHNSDDTRAGSSEKTALHLFTSSVTALMQPRVEQQIKRINQLISEMEKHIRLQLVSNLDISDIDALETAIDENQNVDLTLSRLTTTLDKDKASNPIDPEWLRWALQIVAKLKHLKWQYSEGASGNGRASLAMSSGSNPDNAWSANYPYNPYPFPWASHVTQHAPALAMGLFEGQMLKMAEGFKAIRIAELEIKGKYKKDEHDKFFAYFDWRQFDEQEYQLCPPLISVASEGIGLDSGLQSLSHSLVSGMPIKILILDNKLPAANAQSNKELSLIAMAHRNTFVQQSSLSNSAQLMEGYIDGLNYRGPALWSVYCSNQPENGLANNSFSLQSKLALESRGYPLLSFDPRLGNSWEDCLSLAGNPEIDQDWIIYSLDYTDEYGNKFAMDVPLTYADWALTEAQYSSHFKAIAADSATDDMVLLTDYLQMDEHSQADSMPFIWAVHPESNHLLKVLVSADMVKASQERQDYWHTLKALAGCNHVEIDTQAIADQAKAEMAQTITEGLMNMVGGDAGALTRILSEAPALNPDAAKVTAKPAAKPAAASKPAAKPETKAKAEKKPEAAGDKAKTDNKAAADGFEPVWIETPDCTTCDECVEIAPDIFQYNAEKKAIVANPTNGTYEQIVRSAEKCTAVIIHPGTPWNPDEPNLDKLIKRAEKFQ